jgi:hypothetical protein
MWAPQTSRPLKASRTVFIGLARQTDPLWCFGSGHPISITTECLWLVHGHHNSLCKANREWTLRAQIAKSAKEFLNCSLLLLDAVSQTQGRLWVISSYALTSHKQPNRRISRKSSSTLSSKYSLGGCARRNSEWHQDLIYMCIPYRNSKFRSVALWREFQGWIYICKVKVEFALPHKLIPKCNAYLLPSISVSSFNSNRIVLFRPGDVWLVLDRKWELRVGLTNLICKTLKFKRRFSASQN